MSFKYHPKDCYGYCRECPQSAVVRGRQQGSFGEGMCGMGGSHVVILPKRFKNFLGRIDFKKERAKEQDILWAERERKRIATLALEKLKSG